MKLDKRRISDILSTIAVVIVTLLFCLEMTVINDRHEWIDTIMNIMMLICICCGITFSIIYHKKIDKLTALLTVLFFVTRVASYKVNAVPITYGGTLMLQVFYLVGICRPLFGGKKHIKAAIYSFLVFDIWAILVCYYNQHFRPELVEDLLSEYAGKGMHIEYSLFQNINYAGMIGGAAIVMCVAILLNEKFNLIKTLAFILIIALNTRMIIFPKVCRSAETGLIVVALALIAIFFIKKMDSIRMVTGIMLIACFATLIPLYALVYWGNNENYLDKVVPMEQRLWEVSSGRYAIWKTTILAQEGHRLLGHGNIGTSYNRRIELMEDPDLEKGDGGFIVSADHKRQHNGYLALVDEAGILGTLAFLALMISKLRHLKGRFRDGQWEYILLIYIFWINLFEAKFINTTFFSGLFMMILFLPNDESSETDS